MRFDKFNNFFRIHAASLRKPGTSAPLQVIGIRNFFEYLCGIKVHILVRGYDLSLIHISSSCFRKYSRTARLLNAFPSMPYPFFKSMRSSRPVSYTHLDVYKRQITSCPSFDFGYVLGRIQEFSTVQLLPSSIVRMAWILS